MSVCQGCIGEIVQVSGYKSQTLFSGESHILLLLSNRACECEIRSAQDEGFYICRQRAAFFVYGDSMKNDLATSVAKVAPAAGSNFWLWLTGHDINWWVAVATIAYIGLRACYLIKNKSKRALLDGQRTEEDTRWCCGGCCGSSSCFRVPKFGGLELVARPNPIGIVTACNGDTKDVRAGQRFTPDECRARLEQRLIEHARRCRNARPA